jgi:lipid-A-disaccharide synthase
LLARRQHPDLILVVAARSGFEYPGSEQFTLHRDCPEDVLAATDAALCKSGTVTLQAALAGLPMVVAYRLHPLTYVLARRLVRTSRIGLVNLVAGRDISPEFIQDAATPSELARALRPLLDPAGDAAAIQRAGFAEMRDRLGTPGAGQRVADMAARLVA